MRTWLQRMVAVVLALLVGGGSMLLPSGVRCSGASVPAHACCCRVAADAAAASRSAAAATAVADPSVASPFAASRPAAGGCCSRSAPAPAPAGSADPIQADDSGCRCELRAPAAPMEGARLVLHAPTAVAVLVFGFAPATAPIVFAPAAPDAHSHAPPESTPRAPRGPPQPSFGSIV